MAKNTNHNLNIVAHLVHLSGLLFSIAGPLILYLMYKDKADSFVKSHIVEALNFQLTILLATIFSILIPIIGWFIFLPIISICNLIFCIIASIESSNDRKYSYPIKINFIKN